MKLYSLKLFNHPGIGDLSISFSDPQGVPFDSIIIAGENGCGKTAILEAIQATFEAKLEAKIGIVKLDIMLSDDEANRLSQNDQVRATPQQLRRLRITYDSFDSGWDGYKLQWAFVNGEPTAGNAVVFGEASIKAIFKTFFSEANVSFNPTPARSITALSVDEPTQAERSGAKLAQDITQLLIDVRSADSEDLSEWVDAHPNVAPPNSVRDKRMSRFTRAFDYMFPAKRFRGVSRGNGRLNIQFEENGRISEIDTLSTGEKQIVFRAGFLLKSLSNTRDSLILIDEPELSLHPEWQSRIVDFYKTLLSDDGGEHPQMFISTHSPFVVHGSATSRTVILEKTPTGQVQEMAKPAYPIASGTEAVQAFNLSAFLRGAKQPLLVLVEGESDEEIISAAWSKLRSGQPMPFEIRPALGMKNLNITLNDQELFAKLGSRMIAGIFDFDEAYDQWNGVWKSRDKPSTLVSSVESDGLIKRRDGKNAWAMLLPVPTARQTYASTALKGRSILSIEFLFEDKDIPPHMIDHVAGPLNVSMPKFRSAEKTSFATHVAGLPASSFAAFEPLLSALEGMLAGRH